MEEGEGQGLERIIIQEDKSIKKNVPNAPPLPGTGETDGADKLEDEA